MKNKNTIFLMILGIALLLVLMTPFMVCAEENAAQTKTGVVDLNRVEDLKIIQAENEESILNIPGVVGIGIGLMEDGKTLGFVVYCEKMTPEVQALVPNSLQGAPVRVIESGVFKAY